MSLLLAASAVVSASPSASPVVKVVEKVKEVPVETLPGFFWPLMVVLGLVVFGWLASWVQSLINSHKELGEKANVLITGAYAVLAPIGIALWQAAQAGQIDFSTVNTAVQTAGVVILAAWLRHNGAKLTKPTAKPAFSADEASV